MTMQTTGAKFSSNDPAGMKQFSKLQVLSHCTRNKLLSVKEMHAFIIVKK